MLNIVFHNRPMKYRVEKLICLLIVAFFFNMNCGCRNEEKKELISNDPLSIQISGSESEIKLIRFLTEEFQKKNPGAKIEISGGGSEIGIKDFINGKTDIANSSRMITDAEISIASQNGIVPVQIIMAMDAISIITNPRTGIDSLSMKQLAGLLDGSIKNWKEIGGDDVPVIVIGRNENSGTYHYMLDHLHITSFAEGAQQKSDNNEIVDAVSRKQGAIGYVNLGSIYDENNKPCKNVWVSGIYFEGGQSCSPYQTEYVLNGEYPLTRPLYQYINKTSSPEITNLIGFEISDSTQNRILEHGYFPIKPIYKTINSKNGF